MTDIIVKISKETRMVDVSRSFIGNDGENLQGNIVFKFKDEFVDGIARLEYEMNGEKKYLMLEKVGKEYQTPIKSVLTKKGNFEMQMVITEEVEESGIPIFKSNVFYVYCNKSINAEIEQPDEYPLWIEIANAKILEIDEELSRIKEFEAEVGTLEEDVRQLGQSIDNLDNEIDSISENINLIAADVNENTNNINDLESKYNTLNNELLEQEESINHLDDIKANKDEIPNVNNFATKEYVNGEIGKIDDKIEEIELFKFPNAIIHGEPVINNGQISNFTRENYLSLPAVFELHDRGFEFNLAFRTGSNVTVAQNILGSRFCMALLIENSKIKLRVSQNGSNWDLVDIEGNIDIQPNTTYYVQIYFDKLTYKLRYSLDGQSYTEIASKVASVSPHPSQIYLGVGNNFFNPFGGIINLNRCNLKINNSIVWAGMDTAGLETRMAVDMENIDEEGINRIKEIVKEEIPDVSQFITKEVNNLDNYYTKEEADNNINDIKDMIAQVNQELANLTDLEG